MSDPNQPIEAGAIAFTPWWMPTGEDVVARDLAAIQARYDDLERHRQQLRSVSEGDYQMRLAIIQMGGGRRLG